MFSGTTCDCCGRRFFGKGQPLRRFDNSTVVVCSDACAAVELKRRDDSYTAFATERQGAHAEWADGVRRSIVIHPGAWQVLTIGDAPPDATSIARVGGAPLGLEPHAWPMHDGHPALHVCTLPGPSLGIDAAGLAVFVNVEPDDDGVVPTGNLGVVVPVSSTSLAIETPPRSPRLLRSATLAVAAPSPTWDPTSRAESSRSFIGPIPISFECESMERRWPEGDGAAAALGRFLAQLDGSDLPWEPHADAFREIAGLYVFERGAFVDVYG